MANELQIIKGTSGLTVTARIYLGTSVVGSPISLTEIGTEGAYVGTMPSVSAGFYAVQFFAGGTSIGAGSINWNGTAEVNSLKLEADIGSGGGGGGADPWLTAIPGSYASGTAGNILGNLAATIVSMLALIKNIYVGSSVNGTTISLTIGDDYNSTDGTQVTLTTSSAMPVFTGASVVLFISSQGLSIAGTVVTDTGPTRAVAFNIPASTTSGFNSGAQKYSVVVTLANGRQVTPWRGQVQSVYR